METISRNNDKSCGPDWRIFRKYLGAVGLLLLLVHFIGSFFPSACWGFNQWEIFPVWFRIFCLGACSTFVLLSDRIRVRGKNVTAIFLISIVAFTALAWIFRETKHTGDAYLMVICTEGETLYFSNALTLLCFRIIRFFTGFSGELSSAAGSVMFGALFLYVTARLLNLLSEDARWKLFMFFLLATSGFSMIFFGHVEVYCGIAFGIALFMYAAHLYMKGRVSLYIPVSAAAVAFLLHGTGLILGPSIIAMIAVKKEKLLFRDEKNRLSVSPQIIPAALVPLGIMAVFWTICSFLDSDFGSFPGSLRTDHILVNIFTAGPSPESEAFAMYLFCSFEHIFNLINEQILIAPLGLPIIGIVFFLALRRKIRFSRELWFHGAILAPFLFYAFFYNADLGLPYDWDLFSHAAIPILVFAGFSLRDAFRGCDFGEVIPLMAVINLSHTIPFILSYHYG